MGDFIDDVDMIRKAEYVNALKIGFLNELNDFTNLEAYKSAYDMLIVGNGSLRMVHKILMWLKGECPMALEEIIDDLFKQCTHHII